MQTEWQLMQSLLMVDYIYYRFYIIADPADMTSNAEKCQFSFKVLPRPLLKGLLSCRRPRKFA